ncbi:hypothetical protein QFZ63_001728 [Streptomyces sp. B3I7]|uniref:hypothetical protein n=1 Tax=Streptomyces sp. B3I7 TaxID=3042269 RepID=UPI002787401E|nr:hypothetical protein [Streptomyces sp. B3I7]MDQ0810014.1 hypothetical protein [Streptomyces sp. B3I7]
MSDGVIYWALSGDGDPMDHVEVSGGKLVVDDSDANDDSDDVGQTHFGEEHSSPARPTPTRASSARTARSRTSTRCPTSRR